METQLTVSDMMCGACAKKITAALKAVSGVEDVECDVKGKTVTVKTAAAVDSAALCQAVNGAGFHATAK